MKNFVQEGHALDYIAPAGGVVSGLALLIASILVIPSTTKAEGEAFSGWIEGVYTLPCATGTAWTINVPLYWDDANDRLTSDANGTVKVGMAAAPKLAGDAFGNVKLLPTV